MRNKRAKLIADQRAIVDRADAEGRAMTADECASFDAMEADAEAIRRTLDRVEALERNGGRAVPETAPGPAGRGVSGRGATEYRDAFVGYLRAGEVAPVMREARVQVEGTAASGGYAVPEMWDAGIVKVAADINVMRALSTVRPTGSNKLNVTQISAVGSGGWPGENAGFTESDDTFDEVEIVVHKGTRLLKVSEELLSDSAYPVDLELQDSIGRALGDLEEAAFVNGNGSGKPYGVVVGSALGVTAASATAIAADEVIDLFHSVKQAYRKRGTWLINDTTAKLLRKLKDSTGQYLWQPGLTAGVPDLLLGKPVAYSEDMPAATTGLKSMIFGDMSYYRIIERPGIAVQRLNELYAASGLVGLRAYMRVGGRLVLSEAVKHLIQA